MPSEEERNEPCGYRPSDADAYRPDLPDTETGGAVPPEEKAMHGKLEPFKELLERAEEAHQAEERAKRLEKAATEASAREPLLSTREVTHGDYANTARIAQDLKDTFRTQKGWMDLSDIQRESLDMTATKIARILSGNPNEKDHWLDIAGYAKLVSERL